MPRPTVSIIAALPLLRGAQESTIIELQEHSMIRDFASGQDISLKLPDGSAVLYYIDSGYVTIEADSEILNEPTYFLAWRGKGMLLGEVEVLSNELHKAGITTAQYYPQRVAPTIKATDPCTLIEFTEVSFAAALKNDALIYRNVAAMLLEKMARERRRTEVIQIVNKSVIPSVARTIINLKQARPFREGTSILDGSIEVAHIAGYIGRNIDAVRDAINYLSRKGYIVMHKQNNGNYTGELEILNLSELRKKYGKLL